MVGMAPILVKAGDFWRNSESADIPSLVPRISDRAMVFDTFSSMLRCWLNLGHSRNVFSCFQCCIVTGTGYRVL